MGKEARIVMEKLFLEIIDSAEHLSDFFLTRSREGIFSPALVMWLMICQRAQARHSLLGALECLSNGECDEILNRNQGSKQLGIVPRKISFSRACAFTRIYGNKMRDAQDKKQRKAIYDEFLTSLRQSKLPNRKRFRIEPRKVVQKKRQFPTMKKSRDEEREIAREICKKEGNRGFFTRVTRNY